MWGVQKLGMFHIRLDHRRKLDLAVTATTAEVMRANFVLTLKPIGRLHRVEALDSARGQLNQLSFSHTATLLGVNWFCCITR